MGETDVETQPYEVDSPVARTGPAVRAALGPAARETFESEFRAALGQAETDFDLAPVCAVIQRWWPRAVLAANPELQEGLDRDRRRLADGDLSVLGGTSSYPHVARAG